MVGTILAVVATFACIFLWKLVLCCYLNPFRALKKLTNSGFRGPKPNFPLGNLREIMKISDEQETHYDKPQTLIPFINHDIYQSSLPYFVRWRETYGKLFVYWRGVEPFLYVADPEFLKQMSGKVAGKDWGKATVLRNDRDALFGKFGLGMSEGSDWVRHKHIISHAFSPTSLKARTNLMIECTKKLINQWTILVNKSNTSSMEIDIHDDIASLVGTIMAKTNFGNEGGEALQNALRALDVILYKRLDKGYVGVPFDQLICLKRTLEKRRLSKETDQIFMSIINARRKFIGIKPQHDLLGALLDSEAKLTSRELLDECKTFLFAGFVALAPSVIWTLMILAANPKWQEELRGEINEIRGNREIDFAMLNGLKKMGWVMNEVLRLYPSDVDSQRQALSDIQVGQVMIPKGTNIFIDIMGMNHDRDLWGDDVHEFKPGRFKNDPLYGGCAHKMGYSPFGFGGRSCAGRNYSIMEYKIILSSVLPRFSFTLSPDYRHSPTLAFNLWPKYGMPLIVQYLGTD